MDSLAKSLSLQEVTYSSKTRELGEYLAISAAAFLIPFSIGAPQILVGSLVNAALVLAALNFKNERLLPVILLPSLAVLTRGLVFGSFTPYLVYTIPFIWIGNSLLVVATKKLYLASKMNRQLSVGIGIALKVVFLYATALILIKLGVLPQIFAKAMGVLQLITAVLGMVLALGLNKVIRTNKHNQ